MCLMPIICEMSGIIFSLYTISGLCDNFLILLFVSMLYSHFYFIYQNYGLFIFILLKNQ